MACLTCGGDIDGRGVGKGKFCSKKCRWTWMNNNRALKPNVLYDCIVCGKHVERYVSPSAFSKNTFQFCGRKCKGVYMSGDKHPMWNGGIENRKSPAPVKPNFSGTCGICGKKFKTYRRKGAQSPKFCSVQCTGVAQKGEKNPAYNGGRYMCNGYWAIFMPDHPNASNKGVVLEHRIVMENKIGRLLKDKESVHHVDGNKTNNDPENLMLFKNNREHMKHHAKLRKEKNNG
jgi:hypothetical protein